MASEMYKQLICRLQEGQNTIIQTQFTGMDGKIEKEMKKQLVTGGNFSDLQRDALRHGFPVTKMEQGITIVAEPFYPEERLIILGGGHIALPLVDFTSKIGFSVTVVDDRPDFANIGRFPSADRVICESFEKAIECFRITPNDYVVIITRGHRHDQTCLEKLLSGTEPYYTGMIGSRRRVAAVKEQLLSEGADKGRLDRIHSPIGLSIGAVTPEEIAISIVAELIACKRLGNSEIARLRSCSDVDFSVIKALAQISEPASAITVISSKGSVPRGAGAKMLVYPDGRIFGSIGGGCSEAAVIGAARRIIGTGEYLLQTVDMTGDAAENEGMVCGGVMQVLIEDL